MLKDLSVQPSLKDTLDIWDIQMAEYGRKIIDKRSEFIKELNETVRKKYMVILQGDWKN